MPRHAALGGYRYFCDLYRGWAARLPVTMRQNHRAGEKRFVEYAGATVPVVADRPHIMSTDLSLVEAAHKEWKLEPLRTGNPAGCTSSKK